MDATKYIEILNSRTCPTVEQTDPNELIPSPENEKIYRPVNTDDPEVKRLAASIREAGKVLEPLVKTIDGYLLSGHRRQKAAILAGLDTVPVRTEDIYRLLPDGTVNPEFMQRLTSYNDQRIKNHSELFREALIQTNTDDAYRALLEHREKEAAVKFDTIQVGIRGKRKRISKVKSELVNAAIRFVFKYKKYWPLSDRQIHYILPNDAPLRNTKNRKSRYKTDRSSYKDLCDILTRLRLNGKIPMHAIADPTRPTITWGVHSNPKSFILERMDGFLKGYRRDLQQSQPLHIEVVAEKMTVEGIIRPVCGRFTIPYTVGRGYASLPPRDGIVKRFNESGKERLLLLVLGDFDPEGINIGESLLQSLREDFWLAGKSEAVRVGLNQEHIIRFGLPENLLEAKKSSSRYIPFVKQYGTKVYELEALSPEQLQQILTEVIDGVIDIDAFNKELESEKADAAEIAAFRKIVIEQTKESLPNLDGEEW